MLLWPLVAERNTGFWRVLHELAPLEQGVLAVRLGHATLLRMGGPSGHWVLNTAQAGQMEVARKLVAAALANGGVETPSLWNLRVQGECGCVFMW